MEQELLPWGGRTIVVEGNRVMGLVDNEKIEVVAKDLFVSYDGGETASIYGIINGIRIPISYVADIRVPHIVTNYAGIEIASALSNMNSSLAVLKLLTEDLNIDVEQCITSVKFNGVPYKSFWEQSVLYRKNKYGNKE